MNKQNEYSKEELQAFRVLAKNDLVDFSIYTDRRYDPSWLHEEISRQLMRVERGEVKRLMIFVPPRHGKQMAHDTPILTTKGWTTHGELKIGDYVFGRNGEPVKVLAISDDSISDCIVKFSDGSEFYTHENHEWVVTKGRRAEKIIETKEFFNSSLSSEGEQGKRGNRYKYQVDENKLVHFKKRKLNIDPYSVGVWLGDGKSNGGTICGDKSDYPVIKKMIKNGANLTAQWIQKNTGVHYYSFTGLYPSLRKYGINGVKFIPEDFLFNSVENRLELLAGLIDTDGSRDKMSRYIFTSCSEILAKQVAMLVRSLGSNAYIEEVSPCLSSSGIQGRNTTYRVGFNADFDIPVALERKKNKRKDFVKRKRAIISVERTAETKVGRCIQVEGGIYLVGEKLIPTHNSELGSIKFPAWYLGRHPEKEVITSSYSAELAQDFGYKTRNLVNSEEYAQVFNTRLRDDSKSKAKWLTEEGGGYTATGVGGAITGRGADLAIIDDPFKNREEAESKTIRDKVYNWFTSTLYTRLEKGGAIILILTRWHQDDLAGRLLKAQEEGGEQWEVIKFPAIATHNEKIRKQGEPLWKDKYDLEALENIKRTIGVYDWSALYQQTPVASETQEFKREYWQYRTLEEVLALQTYRTLTIDTAISQKASADYTGLTLNFTDRENKWNIKSWKMKISPLELIDLLFNLHDQYRLDKIGIEKTIYLQAIKPFLDEEMRRRNKFLPIVELEHNQVQKETRIRALLPRYQSGSIFHISGHCIDLEEEQTQFPKGIHDDVLDSCAYQTQIAQSAYNEDDNFFEHSSEW